MNFRMFFIFCVGVTMTGCAQSPKKAYLSLPAQYPTIQDVVSVVPSRQLFLNKEQKMKLTKKDPVLENNGIRSNFHLFEITISKRSPIHLTVQSLCACIGFRKLVMIPQAHLTNANGDVVALQPKSRIEMEPSFSRPASIMTNWTTAPLEPGKYQLIVYADNSNPASKAAKFSSPTLMIMGAAPVFLSVQYTLRENPFGAYYILVE